MADAEVFLSCKTLFTGSSTTFMRTVYSSTVLNETALFSLPGFRLEASLPSLIAWLTGGPWHVIYTTVPSPKLTRKHSQLRTRVRPLSLRCARVRARSRTSATQWLPASPPTSRSGPLPAWSPLLSVRRPPPVQGSQAGGRGSGWRREATGHLPGSEQRLPPAAEAGGGGNPWCRRTMSSSPVPPKVSDSALLFAPS